MKQNIAIFPALAVILLAGCQQAPVATSPSNAPSAAVAGGQSQQTEAITAAPVKIETGYILDESYYKDKKISFTSPEGKTIPLADAAAKQVSADKEDVTSFDVPVDPRDPSIIYFSTYTEVSGNNPYTVHLYSYDVKTGAMKEMMKKVYDPKIDNTIWRTVGRDGNRLLVMEDLLDNSPGPCGSIWVDGYKFDYLDLVKPGKELMPYAVPQSKADEALKEQQKCLQESSSQQ